MTEIMRANHRVMEKYNCKLRFNFYVEQWNRGPEYPVKLWDCKGNRSVPGHIMYEAGVHPRWLNVDNDEKPVRYLHTHVVPDDIVPIRPEFRWLVEKIIPREFLHEAAPVGGLEAHPYPLVLDADTPTKNWDLLVKLNDNNMLLDLENDDVLHCMEWETRAYWIRELLRRNGVGIAFRTGVR